MKLLFELPELETNELKKVIGDEEVLYCTPFDLSRDGQFIEGWLVITHNRLICMEKGSITRKMDISDAMEYKAEMLVGNGILIAKTDDNSIIIARYSEKHVPRYAYIARVLNDLAKKCEPKVKSVDEENTCPKCGRAYLPGTRVCTACINKLAVLKRLWTVVKPYRFLVLGAVSLFTATTVIQLIIPYFYRVLIDNYLIPMNKNAAGIAMYVCAIAAGFLFSMVINITKGRIMINVGAKLSKDLRAMVYAKIQSLSLGYLSKRKTGDLMNRVTGDTARIQSFIQQQSAMGINQTFILIGVCAILLISNWKLALMVILPVPFVLIFCKAIWGKIKRRYHGQSRVWDRANSLLQDILSGIRVVKAFGQEEKEIGRFNEVSRQFADVTGRNEKLWNTLFPSLGFAISFGQFLVLYCGSKLVLGNEMKLGELVQFTNYASLLYGPLSWMTFIPRWFAEAMTSAERVFEIIDEDPDVKDKGCTRRLKINGDTTFKGVTFGYQSHEPVLEDIDLKVKQGEMIGLVGHSGAGKSTLINLLMRFYDVDEGQILIDGVDIRDIPQQDLRSQIGVVLQETFLFSGTILDNIRYSKPDASFDEVIRAAKIANAHDFVMHFPDAYDTRVGEHGHKLSGGERQRIAIARAILHDPKILILDEATSSLDTETEQQIQQALTQLIKNRTTFAIAHRLSTLRNADRILVLEKGRKAELGTHEELLKLKGIYYKLVMAQRQMTKIKDAEGL